jgi:DNA-directed RNA polymerase sigma subunit (sigma70/sigma32)
MKDKKWRYIVSDNIDRIIDTVSSYNPEDEMIDKIDGVIQLDENIDIHNLLEDMPPKYKTIIWDYFFEGKTLLTLGKERGVTKQYMHRQVCQDNQKRFKRRR